MQFDSEQLAARGLLGEASQILIDCDVEFAVVGGWRPFLFNSTPIAHPGTFDVDVLLHEDTTKEAFERAANEFLARGYMRAPKNKFQAHRILNVDGEDLVFHVDFLHRKYAPDVEDLVMEWGKFQSIAGPGTDVVFLHNERAWEKVSVLLPSGLSADLSIPFATEVGLLATKGRSASSAKRTRDAFDIFLVVAQSQDRSKLTKRCAELLADTMFGLSIREIARGFGDGGWRANAAKYLEIADPSERDANARVEREIASFFAAIGLDYAGSA